MMFFSAIYMQLLPSGVSRGQLSCTFVSLSSFQGASQFNGGDEEDRTPDPLRARQVLSQLSYVPKQFPVKESGWP